AVGAVAAEYGRGGAAGAPTGRGGCRSRGGSRERGRIDRIGKGRLPVRRGGGLCRAADAGLYRGGVASRSVRARSPAVSWSGAGTPSGSITHCTSRPQIRVCRT